MAASAPPKPKAKSKDYPVDLQFRGHILSTLTSHSSSSSTISIHSIPYARPPTRFSKAEALPPCYRYGPVSSPGPFTARERVGVCPQIGRKEKEWDEYGVLAANIYVPGPENTVPEGGWPVYFYIHGGFLQFGNANSGDPSLLATEVGKCIVIKPGYRLNLFGFLASSSQPGNLGLWDLRLALEWTYKNISYFGGNADNITVGGYSAGSYAAFLMLAYDLSLDDGKRIIKRVVLNSNGPGIRPRRSEELQGQFEELCALVGVSGTEGEKMEGLRGKSARELIDASRRMKMSQFRPVTDGVFISDTLYRDIRSGAFGRRVTETGVQIIMGENSHEHTMYATARSPRESYDSVAARLQTDYPAAAVKIMMRHYFPTGHLPNQYKSWKHAFGIIYADMQVHATQRGLLDGLKRGGAGELVYRYRIEWRAKCVDEVFPKEMGATHGADGYLWFYGNGRVLEENEKGLVRRAYLDELTKFLKGEKMDWKRDEIRTLRADGDVVSVADTRLTDALQVWDQIQSACLDTDKARL